MKEQVIEIFERHITRSNLFITQLRKYMLGVDPDVKTGDMDCTPRQLLAKAISEKATLEACLEWVRQK